MRILTYGLWAGLVLASCTSAPPPDETLQTRCARMFKADARMAQVMVDESGTDLTSFCTCYARTASAKADTAALHTAMLTAMNDAIAEGATTLDQAADKVEDQIRIGALSGFDLQQFDDLGDYFQDLSEAMGEASGSCPN